MTINPNEQVYLDLLRDVMENGIQQMDRTGVGTLSVFGRTMRFNLRESFPLMTTKRVPFKSVLSELLWFIEGSGDERRLAEILYGQPREELADKTTIWTANAQAPYWKDKANFDGDCGNIYGVMWRKWPTSVAGVTVDQIATLIKGIRKDPNGRRHILSAWNPGELGNMALPPCHYSTQFRVIKGELSLLQNIRSNDLALGAPFNIASYALLARMVAQCCGLTVGDLIINIGDAHIYLNHLDGIEEMFQRDVRHAPQVIIDPAITEIDDFQMEHFQLIGYLPHAAIKLDMAV